ncbi:MAG: Membrane protein, distant similarity to thiosulfate:quinone oxidoreductase DoxD [Hydrogenibacillus schlegelii]|uniref:Membrane protein, distant similarity to thiosulfate:quinone oxidoreductase DoxD n=1 Tax=Hydrogenibacillus schlegelii TaxID=1484 RepID=A0A2T5GBB8_HYDSH|nr:DoxX family protein [Hydrogenibacillus schlegelii]PTQ53472.1 MAG: Membrane protein, distant similarity to thiosulfate:quinone oxidoreductase DoxD [Hydrogenibacillus schlegelii]
MVFQLDVDAGLLIIRLFVGLIVAAHGAQKLFGWFGGHGLGGVGGWLESLGFRPGRLWAALAGGSEFFGGLLFALGLWTPIAAFLIAVVMIVALFTVHVKHGLFITNNGYEYVLILAVVALVIGFLTGPGAYRVSIGG